MSAIPVLVPTFLMLMFMLLYVSSQRQLRRAWRRESEYQIIINDLMRSFGRQPSFGGGASGDNRGSAAPERQTEDA